MKRLGLEFASVGNHEFNERRAELLRNPQGGCHPTATQDAIVDAPVPVRGCEIP